jgi:hypothetical protein
MEHNRPRTRRGLSAARVVDLCLLGALLVVVALAWIGDDKRPATSLDEAAGAAVQRRVGLQDAAARQSPRAVATVGMHAD